MVIGYNWVDTILRVSLSLTELFGFGSAKVDPCQELPRFQASGSSFFFYDRIQFHWSYGCNFNGYFWIIPLKTIDYLKYTSYIMTTGNTFIYFDIF